MPRSKTVAAAAIAVTGLMFAAGCSSNSSTKTSSSGSSTNAATATSIAAFGGMKGLIAAAKKEGQLNVITLPANWANYGTIMKDFTAKYGIKINDANPDGMLVMGPSRDSKQAALSRTSAPRRPARRSCRGRPAR